MLERKKLGPQEALTITDSRRRPTCGIEADFFTVDRVGKEAETAELNRGPTHLRNTCRRLCPETVPWHCCRTGLDRALGFEVS